MRKTNYFVSDLYANFSPNRTTDTGVLPFVETTISIKLKPAKKSKVDSKGLSGKSKTK